MAKSASTVEIEPIDRLGEKIKALVALVDTLRGEQRRLAEDNGRLEREIEALQARLADAAATGSELAGLRAEREQVRARVAEMLDQLEALPL